MKSMASRLLLPLHTRPWPCLISVRWCVDGVAFLFANKLTHVHNTQTGLNKDQLVGVYGEFANDGSDFNFEVMSEESTYPADPTPEEMEFITSVPHLSPSCQVGYCQEFDVEAFEAIKPDYIVMHGYRGELWGFNSTIEKQVVNIIGKPIIYIDVAQQGSNCIGEDNANQCTGKSMIEVIEQYDALATALGIPRPASVAQDKRDMCQAAQAFQEAAEVAQSKGVRALAGYIDATPNATSYLAYPSDDMVLRMFEELGMPILHPGSCTAETCDTTQYFWEWIPTAELFPNCADGQAFSECANSPLYPVDFWLYDHRTTLSFTSPDFKTAFPDLAVMQGQYAYWPIGGGIISYKHAAEILNIVAPLLASAERIHPETSCTAADVSSVEHAQDGLEPSQYACYDESVHRLEYFQCPASDDKALSGGAISGIVIAGVIVLGAIAVFVMRRNSTGKEASS